MHRIIITQADRFRLAQMLTSRAADKARDAEEAAKKGRSPELVKRLTSDSNFSSKMALIFLEPEAHVHDNKGLEALVEVSENGDDI